jgi:hypothetical protein
VKIKVADAAERKIGSAARKLFLPSHGEGHVVPKTNAEKLGIRPASTLTLVNAPAEAMLIGDLPGDVAVTSLAVTNPAVTEPPAVAEHTDVVVLFADDSAQLRRDVPSVLASASKDTKVWIAYRKGGATDVSRDSLMPAFTDLGWHGVSLVSLDATWSAARFRRIEDIGR